MSYSVKSIILAKAVELLRSKFTFAEAVKANYYRIIIFLKNSTNGGMKIMAHMLNQIFSSRFQTLNAMDRLIVKISRFIVLVNSKITLKIIADSLKVLDFLGLFETIIEKSEKINMIMKEKLRIQTLFLIRKKELSEFFNIILFILRW